MGWAGLASLALYGGVKKTKMKNVEMSKPFKAHLQVISEAIIFARHLCEQNGKSAQAANLLDAIHNTAKFIQSPFCKNSEYVALYYESYDRKWKNVGVSLIEIYKSYDPEISEFQN